MTSYAKLPPEDKEAWVKALRSGDFKQAKGILCDHQRDSYCCLGVKLKLMGYEPGTVGELCYPQLTNGTWVNVIGVDEPARAELIRMNDHGSTFEEIADWIEKNL